MSLTFIKIFIICLTHVESRVVVSALGAPAPTTPVRILLPWGGQPVVKSYPGMDAPPRRLRIPCGMICGWATPTAGPMKSSRFINGKFTAAPPNNEPMFWAVRSPAATSKLASCCVPAVPGGIDLSPSIVPATRCTAGLTKKAIIFNISDIPLSDEMTSLTTALAGPGTTIRAGSIVNIKSGPRSRPLLLSSV